MKTVSRIRRLDPEGEFVSVLFSGTELWLRKGENLAAELLAANVMPFRYTPVSGSPRNPYCMMGACFDCLVVIDGVSRQACMVEVSSEMIINMPPVLENNDD